MQMFRVLKIVTVALLLSVAVLVGLSQAADGNSHTSSQFQGKSVLTLSDDFVVPDTPDPHWQVVDSDGNTYLLDKLKTKAFIGTNYKKEIVVPPYVNNISKVVIWCAFAEVNLGEAKFSSPVK